MKVGILGSGTVGRTLAEGFLRVGDDPMIGTRDVAALMSRTEPDRPGAIPFPTWHEERPEIAVGSFADAGSHGEILVNATVGTASIAALRAAGAAEMDGTVVIDTSNPLDLSGGFPPTLFVSNDDSLAETIQREFPRIRVVKACNTVTATVNAARDLCLGLPARGDVIAALAWMIGIVVSFVPISVRLYRRAV